ncbi:MAG: hypothetical protein KGD58_19000, partial [Candidatus Lokiarchaeota archaeon]|nr:hypothetical protein [Candidatus Lokiarchaeota archaeon]
MIETSFLQGLIENPEKISNLDIENITEILLEAKNIFEDDTLLLEFDMGGTEEVYVIGDIHGNLVSLLK